MDYYLPVLYRRNSMHSQIYAVLRIENAVYAQETLGRTLNITYGHD